MNVAEIVTETLQSEGRAQYVSYASGVISAIEEKVDGAVAHLTDFAVSRGLSEEQIESVLIEAGLVTPEPEAEQVEEFETIGEGIDAVIATIAASMQEVNQTLNGLVGFARNHGFRG